MKSMKKLEVERLVKSKNIFTLLSKLYNGNKSQSFVEFKQSNERFVPHIEFEDFLGKASKNYIKPSRLLASKLLIGWRSPFHLFEDLMWGQIEKKRIERDVLCVPFIFEYLMEYLDTESAIRDPDILSLSALSPKDSDYEFVYFGQLHPEYKAKGKNEECLMKISDLFAVPILIKQV